MSDTRTFDQQISEWLAKVEARRTQLFFNVYNSMLNSITDGLPVTGAPGQPVDTGALKASWLAGNPFSASEPPDFTTWTGIIGTKIAYAPAIEEGTRAAYDPQGETPPREKLPSGRSRPWRRSEVGGHHSVKLTRAAFDKIVEQELREIIRESGG